jgi:hypothetical protein
MDALAHSAAFVVAAVNLVAGAWGGLRWWQVQPDRGFWVGLRAGQAVAALYVVLAGVVYVAGFRPSDSLFWLYVLLPIPVSFVAEQLRAVSAQTVLDARGLEDAEAVGRLDAAGQKSVVRAIMRREMGVMALSALVVVFLALRAVGTA